MGPIRVPALGRSACPGDFYDVDNHRLIKNKDDSPERRVVMEDRPIDKRVSFMTDHWQEGKSHFLGIGSLCDGKLADAKWLNELLDKQFDSNKARVMVRFTVLRQARSIDDQTIQSKLDNLTTPSEKQFIIEEVVDGGQIVVILQKEIHDETERIEFQEQLFRDAKKFFEHLASSKEEADQCPDKGVLDQVTCQYITDMDSYSTVEIPFNTYLGMHRSLFSSSKWVAQELILRPVNQEIVVNKYLFEEVKSNVDFCSAVTSKQVDAITGLCQSLSSFPDKIKEFSDKLEHEADAAQFEMRKKSLEEVCSLLTSESALSQWLNRSFRQINIFKAILDEALEKISLTNKCQSTESQDNPQSIAQQPEPSGGAPVQQTDEIGRQRREEEERRAKKARESAERRSAMIKQTKEEYSTETKAIDQLIASTIQQDGHDSIESQQAHSYEDVYEGKGMGRLAEAIAKRSTLRKEGKPSFYNLESSKAYSKVQSARWFDIGKPTGAGGRKVILLMGATGSGKSTLVDAMVNYVLGVQWQDPFRFKVVPEETKRSQAESQTQCITSYTIHHTEGMAVPYSLTIIDTPGFGDTGGVARDEEIARMLCRFITHPESRIDDINAICFVASSADTRLTPTQEYIITSVLSIFGRDVMSNIRLLVTFSDGSYPPVVTSCLAANFPFELQPTTKRPVDFYKFNNSVVFASNDDGSKSDIDRPFWQMAVANFKAFFEALDRLPAKSLQQSKKVMEKRRELEASLNVIRRQLDVYLRNVYELQSAKQKQQIEKTFDVINDAEVNSLRHCDVYRCDHCELTSTSPANFEVVPCRNGKHELQISKLPFEGQWKQTNTAAVRLMSAEEALDKCEMALSKNKNVILYAFQKVSDSERQMSEIGLRSTALKVEDYVDMMTSQLERQAAQGYKEKRQILRELLKKWKSGETFRFDEVLDGDATIEPEKPVVPDLVIDLGLAKYPQTEQLYIKKLNDKATVEDVELAFRQIFGVAAKSCVRLWTKGTSSQEMQLQQKTQTIGQLKLVDRQVVVGEVQSSDGRWPRETWSDRPHDAVDSPVRPFAPGLCGLDDLQDSSFMNSVLQCLSHTPPFVRHFASSRGNCSASTAGKMSKSLATLLTAMWSGSHQSLSPTAFKELVDRSALQRKDAHEFLMFLLQKLSEDQTKRTWWPSQYKSDDSVGQLFRGQVESTCKCLGCGKVSVTNDTTSCLSLDIPRNLVVHLVPLDSTRKPIRFLLTVPRMGTVQDLLDIVAKSSGIAAHRLRITRDHQHRFGGFPKMDSFLSQISDDDAIYVYEVADVVEETFYIPVYQMVEAKNSIEAVPFGLPILIPATNELFYSQLSRMILEKMTRYVKPQRPYPFSLKLVDSHGTTRLSESSKAINLARNGGHVLCTWEPVVKEASYDSAAAEQVDDDESFTQRSARRQELRLDDCLKCFTSKQSLPSRFCPSCSKLKRGTRKWNVTSLADVLVIHLKRFDQVADKVDVAVDFPVQLDMAPHIPSRNGPALYDLIGVCNHHGSRRGGHYTTYAKNDGRWYLFDDRNVSNLKENSLCSKAAYLLFYLRRQREQDTML